MRIITDKHVKLCYNLYVWREFSMGVYLNLNGSLIKMLRIKADLSQAELAAQINMSRIQIARIESGRVNNIKLTTAMKIAKFFNIKVEDLYYKNYDNEMNKILDIIKRLPTYSSSDQELIRKKLQDFYVQMGSYFEESAQ